MRVSGPHRCIRRVVKFMEGRAICVEEPMEAMLADYSFRVDNCYSLISPGTEIALLERREKTFRQVGSTDDGCSPGYCSIGRVSDIGDKVETLQRDAVILHFTPHSSSSILDVNSTRRWIQLSVAEPSRIFLLARFLQIAWSAVYSLGGCPKICVVSGAGLIGLTTALLLRSLGSDVLVVTSNAVRRNIAEECGLRAEMREHADLSRATCVVDATGYGPHILSALNSVGFGATLVLLGSPRAPVVIDLYGTVHRKGLRMVGAHEMLVSSGSSAGWQERLVAIRRAVALIESNNAAFSPLIRHVVSATNIESAYLALQLRKMPYVSAVIQWDMYDG